ncbi:SRPBCC family protein [Dactylosporangium sp. CS-047395]|uniref:SRPBCC family protein n=1 Tax=Dactylosporangium sp. CS-047395 TaxID=3239936 RepID=UPI003D8FBED4
MTDSHEFELTHDIDLPASPEQVWQAIATGPGIDSWFMGRNEVEPRLGGRTRMVLPMAEAGGTITGYEPNRRFAFRSDADESGAFMAFEYLIEGRDGGSTTLRMVHSGILTGNWEEEYDALKKGNPLYLRSLAQYLEHFPGRVGVPVAAFGPQQPDQDTVWAGLTSALHLSKDVQEGDAVRLTFAGQEVSGVVDTAVEPSFLGVRTGDALLRFVGRGGFVMTGHHLYSEIDREAAEAAWTAWLAGVFA